MGDDHASVNEPFDIKNSQMDFDIERVEVVQFGTKFNVKPIAVFNVYLGTQIAASPKTVEVKCFKGSCSHHLEKDEFLKACEDVYEVKNNFDYDYDLIPPTFEIKKTIDLPSAGTFAIFQTAIIYGFRWRDPQTSDWRYLLEAVYANDVFAVPMDHVQYDTVPYNPLYTYFLIDGLSRWSQTK
ncbi:hypothetical protein DFA_04283 [Cavenderia fasciculata]|uniref:Monalysin Pore-forming domain-containing protein n=1 Tax=Cavenderia fasciculata TaxID=261658 RepID=F4PP52_CACFS|nr:uncharacterized protein DFA_04283 [Cavenderia fasciculata]EGG22165.1 hypothetical protein DFA_04283 [Cavenderia fasciculata]|eukprot:XP_004360016.1 hypothetical protein DFA_04283 [Cavenderia fasciculata]